MFFALVALGYLELVPAYGRWQAARDINAGDARYLAYGELASNEAEVARVMRSKYNVRLERVAGCVVNDALVRRCNAYNQKVSQHVGLAGGRNVFHATIEDVMKSGAGGAR